MHMPLEQTLNLRSVTVYDRVTDADGTVRSVVNPRETMLAQQKQSAIKEAFAAWIWKDPQRRMALEKEYNERFNSLRPAEFSGEHINFVGMNPLIGLRTHQKNAIAHILYGGNTLLAHEVGAGKTFTMQQLRWKVNVLDCAERVCLWFRITLRFSGQMNFYICIRLQIS